MESTAPIQAATSSRELLRHAVATVAYRGAKRYAERPRALLISKSESKAARRGKFSPISATSMTGR